ncbi:LexA family transcriptional regulator [Limnobacter litoralis]|uniref:Cro/Cl family transcriptional regulator n=1 Tax=Limnobacter litoralis TaxID=481366 RepID=A0ABQ5YR35_9BURK|nr:S24 family peptidase [Limnobacter litoralis]GLR26532.1 Cro/Cl family transcriptional regulator [Limnobacter litoralis]
MHIQMKRLYEAAKALKNISNQSELARHLNVSPQTVNNWEERGISKQGMLTAQKTVGCSAVWLETGQTPMEFGSGQEIAETNSDYVSFDLLDVQASAGPGCSPVEFPEIVRKINVLDTWAKKNLGSNTNNIRLISARGTSMQGTIENGDILFVDSAIRHFDGDGIYVICRGTETQVKRLQMLHGNVLAIISDNRLYESEKLTAEEADSLVICGRVVASWTLKKFW